MKQSKKNSLRSIIIFLFSHFVIFTLFSFNATKNQIAKRETIEISIKDFGKCRPLNNDFFEITKLKKNKITSAFYYSENDTLKSIPVNDETFNYKYFYNKIYPLKEGAKIKLEVKKYLINKTIVLVAFKVK
jgi:hypothetical protein